MARSVSYVRDSDSRTWKQVKGNRSKAPKKDNNNKKSTKGNSTSSDKKNDGKSEVTDKKNSKGKVNKKQKKIEYNTLSGEIVIVPNSRSIKIKAGDTISVKGIGKYLSGKYYVQDVTRQIDQSSGYSQSMTLLKPNFRKTLKKVSTTKKKKGGKK